MLQEILDWSEVWALLIPIIAFLNFRKQPKYFRPIIIYLFIALIIDLLIDYGWKFYEINKLLGFQLAYKEPPRWLVPNNYLYNLHSMLRFICFSAFFIYLKQPFLIKIKKYLPLISLLFILINFLFFEKFLNPVSISSRLFATEAGVLLFYCLQYYLYKLQDDSTEAKKQRDFWVVFGLSIYVCFNFPFFLLYTTLKIDDAVYWWNFHNVSFIVLCIFIAKAFYVSGDRY